ncbi:MAG TPA: DUF2071 domain-containing protein [Pirellulaceae bacterium]|nr:DUF2071 domain-containing protein [Pirellulaceae bacterium]
MNAPVDRIAPTRRPAGKSIGFQNWSELLFLHREVPVEAVAATLPAGLEPDLHEGKAYVGVVPFRMSDVRPWWAPQAFAFNFLETNVRTYVLCNGEPGVYFYSLEANSPVAVFVARNFWGLPYFHAQMNSVVEDGATRYVSVRKRRSKSDRRTNDLTDVRDGVPRLEALYCAGDAKLPPSPEGSLDRFLIERYYLFVRRGRSILRGQVHHVPYPLREVTVESVEDSLAEAAGFPATQPPFTLFHYSPGVEVELFPLVRVAASERLSSRTVSA